jgi:Ca-activated chloride channel family protein
MLFFLLSLVFVGSAAFAAQPDQTPGMDPDRAQTGSLFLKCAQDAPAFEALRMNTSFRVQVTGNVARVSVSQQFTNPSDDWVEGLYVFPLSTDSAVDELLMHVGERVIRGDIQRKETARAVYEQARAEGRRASLVDQERPNMFTTSVANIAPHSSITIEIAYLETIAYRDGRYTLRLPLAITPRYTPRSDVAERPGADAGADTDRADTYRPDTYRPDVDATMGTPELVTNVQQKVNIDVELAPGFPLAAVDSLHHQVATTSDAIGRHVKLTGSQVPADRDFELVWTPAAFSDVQGSLFAERDGSDTYAMLILTPPRQEVRSVEPREVQFIIDTSGSMEGPSIEQARAALQMGIDRLAPHDRFNIIRFSDNASSLFQVPQQVSGSTRALASQFIASLRASGGTEMRPPLEIAFGVPAAAGLLRQIVFITDGSVGNEAQIVDLIRRNIGASRLFTVGIGGSPNAFFLQEAATAGRGSYTFIAERSQVQARMEDLFRKIESPALVQLALQWPGLAKADLATSLPSDLYSGDPLIVLARLPEPPAANQVLRLSGRIQGSAWSHEVPIISVSSQAGISKLWARERIGSLSRERKFGGDATQLEQAMVNLALQYHLVSEFTSLVAVDDTPARPADVEDRSEQVPISAPAGSYWARTTGFAKTATAAPLTMRVGTVLVFLALMLYLLAWVRGRRPAGGTLAYRPALRRTGA